VKVVTTFIFSSAVAALAAAHNTPADMMAAKLRFML
jgi:hypothetical protein